MILLEARQLKKSIADRELFSADVLRVASGDRIGIVGRNGAGKTTLLNVLAGMDESDEGAVSLSATVGVIPQLKPDLDRLSGGEATFRYIEEAFDRQPDIVFADEPTMHLDLEHTARLEARIAAFPGALVVISHDRAFLDRVCTKIWAIEERQVGVYRGGYSAYAEQREMEKRRRQAEYEAYVDKKRQLEQAVMMKRQQAERMIKPPKRTVSTEFRGGKPYFAKQQKGVHKTVKAIETRLEKLEKVEKPRELPPVKLDIPNADIIRSRNVIRAERAEAVVGGRVLWRNASFRIRSGDKVALLGPNGSGKTTLIRSILRGDDGFRIGTGVKLGYFSQNLDILDPGKSILANVQATSPHDEYMIRTVLARLLFRNEAVFKPVGVLSGGERVKTAFAKVFLSDMNVLLMDEPTNFLDIESIEALESLLIAYEGTVLFATHDRRLAERAATKILDIRTPDIVEFDGTYEAYRERRQGEAGAAARDRDAEELLLLEMRITELLARLSLADAAAKPELEAEFQRLIDERNRLKRRD